MRGDGSHHLGTSRRSQDKHSSLTLLPAWRAFYFWREILLHTHSTSSRGDLGTRLGQLSQKEHRAFSTCSGSLLKKVLSLHLHVVGAPQLFLYIPVLVSSEHHHVPLVPSWPLLLPNSAPTYDKIQGDEATLFWAEAEGLIFPFCVPHFATWAPNFPGELASFWVYSEFLILTSNWILAQTHSEVYMQVTTVIMALPLWWPSPSYWIIAQ